MSRRATRPSETAGRRNIATAAALCLLFGAGGMALAASHAAQAGQSTQATQATQATGSTQAAQANGGTDPAYANATFATQAPAPTYHVTTHTS